MKNQRRRRAKERREAQRRALQLRPEGGPQANNGKPASSLRSRHRDLQWLLAHKQPAPTWY